MIGDAFEQHEHMEAYESSIIRNVGLSIIEPPISMKKDGSGLIIEISVPGFRREDINVVLKRNRLSFYADKVKNASNCVDAYFCTPSTITYYKVNEFLPFSIVPEKATIIYENGVFGIRAPLDEAGQMKNFADRESREGEER